MILDISFEESSQTLDMDFGESQEINGFSPIATVTQTDDGAVISITDLNGTTTATVKDGKDGNPGVNGKDGAPGYTPQKGVDYFTEAEKEEMVQAVLAALPDGDEVNY